MPDSGDYEQVLAALSSPDPTLLARAVQSALLTCVRGGVAPNYRAAFLPAVRNILTGATHLAPTPESYAAIRPVPEILLRLDADSPRTALSSPACIRPGNLALGHVLTKITDRYDERVRGVARAIDPTLITTVIESLARGPWIVPSREVEQDVRVAALRALACVNATAARRVLKTPSLLRLRPEDIRDHVGTEIRALLRSHPTPEDAVYWGEDHVSSLRPDTLAVLAAFQLFMETSNDGLEHALSCSMASPHHVARGLRLLELPEIASLFEAGPHSATTLQGRLLQSLPTASRRVARYIRLNPNEFAAAPGAMQ